MAEIEIPAADLPPLVSDIGLLTGLLTRSSGNTYFDLGWFQNALSNIEAIPGRRAALMKLLRDLLGTPAPNTPTDRAWYLLEWEGKSTYTYVVLPPDDSGAGETIGFGLLHTFDVQGVTIQAYVYVPLFVIPVGSPIIVTGSSGYPIEFVLAANTKETFSAGGVSFTGLQFTGNVYFTGAVPGYELSFLGLNPPQPQSTFNTLADLQGATVVDWVNAVLGNATVGGWLDTRLGQTPFTVGGILGTVGILQQNGGQYSFGSFDALVGKTPLQIAEFLLGQGLKYLATNKDPILSFAGGGIWIYGEADGAATDYGLRLQVPDIDVSPANGPTIKIQLGKLLSTDTDTDSWISRSDKNGKFADPGLSLTVLSEDANNDPSFKPKLDLISIGVDVSGTQGKPLFDIDGAQLGGIEPRILISLDFADLATIPWGVAVECDGIGFPLGNSLSGASSNPVAQNLLSSGTSDSGGDKEAINPTFSVSVAKVFDPNNTTRFDVNLQQPGGGGTGTVWIPVQRSFGPLECSRIGIQWPDPNPGYVLTLLFDGGVKLAVLEVDLQGLSLGIPLATPGQISSYALDLMGLAVSYEAGPVALSGGLLKDTTVTPTEYEGEALIKAASWSISAIGAYASLDGQPSLFIFAQLDATIGGPPVFFITGLCAGFGYNRGLTLPTQDQVASFPLLAGISDPSKIGGKDATPAQALAALSTWVPPMQGVNWLAAGVQFTSFELIQSNAVVAAVFGKDFELAILGLSRIKLPQVGPEQFAYAELQLEVILHPSAGFFGATAMLTSNSYVLVPACHLTGGFAFYLWYGDQHPGDFVLTIGGYHPAFSKPAWYPDEPRLGFSWQVSDNLTIQGNAYFALTPSCVMGGGLLDVEFHAGNLRAWFKAQADFLFHWKPFYFTGYVGVSIGASYKLDLLFCSVTITVELGASLEIYGPKVGGKVHVDWYIISFTIPFGADPGGAGTLDWADFAALLPQNDSNKRKAVLAAADVADEVPLANVIKLIPSSGLVRTDEDGNWQVRADTFSFAAQTAFPLTEVDLCNSSGETVYTPPATDPPYYVAVRPMAVAGVTSVMDITVTGKEEGVEDIGTAWNWQPHLNGAPAAMWGTPDGSTSPAAPSADTLPHRLLGIDGLGPKPTQPTGPGPIPIANLLFDPIDENNSDFLPLAASEAAVNRQPQASATSLQTIADTVATTAVTLRGEIFAALAAFGFDAGANGTTADIAAAVNLGYPNAPLLGAPWQVTT